jgi:SAM-dependent methyltransferase
MPPRIESRNAPRSGTSMHSRRGETVSAWYEDETFREAFFPYMFPDERFDAADAQVESIVTLANVHGGGAVLDLCCGPGRHTVAFAHKGFHVTGVDLSSFLLVKARERSRAFNVDVEWVHEDTHV